MSKSNGIRKELEADTTKENDNECNEIYKKTFYNERLGWVS